MPPHRAQLSFIDTTGAYSNARVEESDAPTFVGLPDDDPDSQTYVWAAAPRHVWDERCCRRLAGQYIILLLSFGFAQGVSCPNVFHHADRNIDSSVHGDDFTSEGGELAFDWFEA